MIHFTFISTNDNFKQLIQTLSPETVWAGRNSSDFTYQQFLVPFPGNSRKFQQVPIGDRRERELRSREISRERSHANQEPYFWLNRELTGTGNIILEHKAGIPGSVVRITISCVLFKNLISELIFRSMLVKACKIVKFWLPVCIRSSLNVNLTLIPGRFIGINFSISNPTLPERIWLNPDFFDFNTKKL